MTDLSLTQVILKELAGLPESRQVDVLTFIRFLKVSLASSESIAEEFDHALSQARKISENRGITPEDIDSEIQGYRTNK